MSGARDPERFDTVVIGGGQAGLAVGYHLAQRGIPFVILDASKRIGDAWRNRWDSLRLFSPNFWNHLPGMPFPGPKTGFATKDEMADFLEAYAAKYQLPVRSGIRVDKLTKDGDRYVVTVTKAPGRKMRKKLLTHGAPLVRTKPKDIDAARARKELPQPTAKGAASSAAAVRA